MESFLARYRMVQQVGKGSFSTIYLVRSRTSGRLFAAKHLPKAKSSVDFPEVTVVRLLQKSPHPNIVHTAEILEDEKDIFLIQEYAERGNLVQYLQWKEKQLQKDKNIRSSAAHEDESKRLVWQLLCAVAHLHTLGVAHRDIKLENVLITSTGDLKLADFNLSCFFSTSPTTSPRSSLHRQCCGTPLYSAPELYFGVPYKGPELDVWSIGVFTYRLLFGVFPFRSERADKQQRRYSLQRKIMTANYTFPTTTPEVSEEAKELLRQVFVINPKDRPEVIQLLHLSWVSTFPSPTPPPFSVATGSSTVSSPRSTPLVAGNNNDALLFDASCKITSTPSLPSLPSASTPPSLPSPSDGKEWRKSKAGKLNDTDAEFSVEGSKLKHKMRTAIKLISHFSF